MQISKSQSLPIMGRSETHEDDAKSSKSAQPLDGKIKFLLSIADSIYDCQQKGKKSFRVRLGKVKFDDIKNELLMCDYVGLVFLRTGNVLKVNVYGNKKPEKTEIISDLLKTVPDHAIEEDDVDKKESE